MKVLVTGGAGYIGSHTVKALIEEGHDVTIFDNFSTGKKELVFTDKVIKGELMDKDTLAETFHSQKFDAVLHFASLIQVGESYQDPHKYFAGNLITTLNLLETMLEAGVKNFIFSSSAAVYGVPHETPITEAHPLKPYNPYGQSKFFVEEILQEYDRAYGLRFISLRYFNAAGADPEGEAGEMHDPETHLIPNLLLSLLGKKDIFQLFGTDFPTPDGTAVRDYIHVSDLASAHVLALNNLLEDQRSDFINLGTNKGYSVREVMEKTEEITNKKLNLLEMPRRKGDVPVLLASKTKAESILGWRLFHSDLETIIKTAWHWHSKTL